MLSTLKTLRRNTYEMCKLVCDKKDLCREIASNYVTEESAKIASKTLQEEQFLMGDFFGAWQ